MSFYFPNVDPTYLFKRKGTDEDPFLFLQDTGNVVKEIYILREIPSHTEGIVVKDNSGNTMVETTVREVEDIAENEYRVNYSEGILHFNPIQNGKEVTAEYTGMGFVNIPATRVRTLQGSDNALETLQDALNRVQEGIEIIENVGELEFGGEYNSTSSYKKWNFVYHKGKTYVATYDVTGENPESSSKWSLVSSGMGFSGVYDEEKIYDIGDVVANVEKKSIYVSKITNNDKPLDDETGWDLILTLDDFIAQVDAKINELEQYRAELEELEEYREEAEDSRNERLDDALEDLDSFIQIIQAEDEIRTQGEEARETSEILRADAENTREEQEVIRQNNENERVSAESNREQGFEDLIVNTQETVTNTVEEVDEAIEGMNGLKDELRDIANSIEGTDEAIEEHLQYIDNLRHRGEYLIEETYYRNNIVTFNGEPYMALKESEGIEPDDEEFWHNLIETGLSVSDISIEGVSPDENGEISLIDLELVRQEAFDEYINSMEILTGELPRLRTVNKDSLVDAINELKSRIDDLVELLT